MFTKLPARKTDAHKGDFGHALLIGGSRNMPGAISLAASGALRAGAGLVTVATASSCHAIVAMVNPCAMSIGLPEDGEGRISRRAASAIESAVQRATCIAIGPGLGQSRELSQWIHDLYLNLPLPLVLDADAINALAGQQIDFSHVSHVRIFTPHVGEFRRLSNSTETEREAMELEARKFAAMTGAIVLLKGHRSFASDGQRHFRNETGNAAMATGGCGDVLTGIIAAFLCQKMPPFDAVCYAAQVHGLAGDIAAKEIGPVGVIASDVAARIPAALQRASRAT